MSIKYAILGFLSETPLTGYDLKKLFAESEVFHWSGNNNQIYRTLVELHQEQLVTITVQVQESKPPRKIYTITDAGLQALRQWLLSTPELPQFKSALSMQLTWADQLDAVDLDKVLAAYEDDLQAHIVLVHEKARRQSSNRTTSYFKDRIVQHWLSVYELELTLVRSLRQEVLGKEQGNGSITPL
ncbi:MAG: PadR family transcriptional regulator [Anaerolineae bacterium]|nr:PadR family transcriptional regulator [Anaerolineae bacterium]